MTDLLNDLLSSVQEAIKETVPKEKVGIAFSGGIDSSLLAKMCTDLGYQTTLLTIGFQNSHDIIFSKQVNKSLQLLHKILEIDQSTFSKISSQIKEKIKTDNLSWNENCIAFYYVSELASQNNIKTVVTANGIDELFCGYNAYRDVIESGEEKVIEFMDSKIDNELQMMESVNLVSAEFSVKIVQPFLSVKFIKFAKTVPISNKISGPDDLLRKHIVRQLGAKVGVPEISVNKRKKAVQYGSLIHKTLTRSS